MTIYKTSPFVTLCFFLYLLNLSNTDPTKPKEMYCCAGWNDVAENVIVVKVMASHCQNQTKCAEGSTTDCVTLHAFGPAGDVTRQGERSTDCPQACDCEEDWCNCPLALQGKDPEPGVIGLRCCTGSTSSSITEIDCPNLNNNKPPQPQECTTIRLGQGPTQVMSCEPSDYRPYANCTNYSHKRYSGDDGGCRCKTNRCNCVASASTMKTPKTTPNSTGTAAPTAPFSTTTVTIKNFLEVFLGFGSFNFFLLPFLSRDF